MGVNSKIIVQLFELVRFIESLQKGGYLWHEPTETTFSKGIHKFISDRELLHPFFEGMYLNTVCDPQGNELYSYLNWDGERLKHDDYVHRIPCVARAAIFHSMRGVH